MNESKSPSSSVSSLSEQLDRNTSSTFSKKRQRSSIENDNKSNDGDNPNDPRVGTNEDAEQLNFDMKERDLPISIKIPKHRDRTSSSSTVSRILDFSPRRFSILNLPNRDASDQEYTPQDSDSIQEESSSSDEDDREEIVVDAIIACRRDTIENWNKRCKKMNSSEVRNGSLWSDPSSVSCSQSRLQALEERFLVKWAEMSYIHCSWEKETVLVEQTANGTYQLNSFFKRFAESGYRFDVNERGEGEFFDDSLVQINRVLEVQGGTKVILDRESEEYEDGDGRQLMIKWCSLPYSESTYEYERDLILMGVEYESHCEEYAKRQRKPSLRECKYNLSKHDRLLHHLRRLFRTSIANGESAGMVGYVQELQGYIFRNGGKLRDYQAEGVAWMVANYVNGRSSILADEMGLGKTIQTAAFLRTLNDSFGNRGPFLIVAPLSTVVQWYREISKWTDLNVVLYTGNAADRAMIREYEFAFPSDRPDRLKGRQKYLKNCHKGMQFSSGKMWMVQIVITTPETLLSKDQDELMSVDWEMLIVDEAHNRLKSQSSKFAMCLRQEKFLFRHCLLLTGTPIQNHMGELWTLLNVIDPNVFADLHYFLGRFGSTMQGKERVDELHEVIRPYMLRRLKEDVEKNLPTKEETIIEVELTSFQKKYYRALYEKNRKFLMHNKSGIDSANIVMELRKCCNHPFLLNGVEEIASQGIKRSTIQDEIDFLVKSSGKLVLLDKLLPKLKDGGHRVLIFSQFKIMLNVIEDYLILKEFLYERVDGAITGKKRQVAIDRFQNDSSTFVMLLTTKAGGVGINLTAADTCIIFDSDWNPQNDLQAQARCHRIGQTKSVKIYRFLTKKTYEMRLFHLGSMKMGLDKAVLQGVENKGEDALTAEDAERLLRFGAYEVLAEDGNEVESNSFMEEDIDTILMSRARTRVHATDSSNDFTFNKASFKASNDDLLEGSKECNVDIDDPDFWTKIFASSDMKEDGATPPETAPVKEPNGVPEAGCMNESTHSDDNDGDYEGESAARILSSTPRKCQLSKSSQKSTNEVSMLGQEHADSNTTAKILADEGRTIAKSTVANTSFPDDKHSRPKASVPAKSASTTPIAKSTAAKTSLPDDKHSRPKASVPAKTASTTPIAKYTAAKTSLPGRKHPCLKVNVPAKSASTTPIAKSTAANTSLPGRKHPCPKVNVPTKTASTTPIAKSTAANTSLPGRKHPCLKVNVPTKTASTTPITKTTAANTSLPDDKHPCPKVNVPAKTASTTPTGLGINPDIILPVDTRYPRIDKKNAIDGCSIPSEHELQQAVVVGFSLVIHNQRRRSTTRVGPENNSEKKINVLKPEIIAIQTSPKRRRGRPRPRKVDLMAESNDETKNNAVKPEVIAIQTSHKRPRGRPRKKLLGNNLDSLAPVPGRKRGRPPKVLQPPLPTVGSDRQLRFEKSDVLNKSRGKKSPRKIKKPEFYEPQEILRSPSKIIVHSMQNERNAAVGQTTNRKKKDGGDREGIKRKRPSSVVEGAPKKKPSVARATTSQSLPRRNTSYRRRSEGDQNPCSWAFMGSSASVEQKQETLPEDRKRKVKHDKRTQRLSHGSVLENLLSSVK